MRRVRYVPVDRCDDRDPHDDPGKDSRGAINDFFIDAFSYFPKGITIPEACQLTLIGFLVHDQNNGLSQQASAGIDNIPLHDSDRFSFTGNETVINECKIVGEDAVGRNDFHVSYPDAVSFFQIVNDNRFPFIVLQLVNCQWKIGFEVAIKSKAFIRFALKPSSNQQKEY